MELSESCIRYPVRSIRDICKGYQKYSDGLPPEANPCKGCEKRIEGRRKKKVALRMRQGGRHKPSPESKNTEEIIEKKRRYALEYYHAHKVLRGVKKEKTNPTEIVCKGCLKKKPADDFYKQPACLNGHRPRCKSCENIIRVEYARKRRLKENA